MLSDPVKNILRKVGGFLLVIGILFYIATLGNWAWLAMVDKGLHHAVWPYHIPYRSN